MKKKPANKETFLTRSSAAEYLTFITAKGEGGVEAIYADEDVWLSQKMMAVLALIIDWSTVAKPPQGRDTAASPGAVVVAPVERARACARAPARTRRGGAERRSAQRPWCHRAA